MLRFLANNGAVMFALGIAVGLLATYILRYWRVAVVIGVLALYLHYSGK